MNRNGKKTSSLDISVLPALPKNWRWTTIEELTTLVTKGSSPRWQGFEYVEDGVAFIRSQNIRWGTLDLTERVFVPESFNEKHEKTVIREGDVLLNLVGASVGRTAVATQEVDGANLNQAVAIIRLAPDGIQNRLLVYFLLSPFVQSHVARTKQDVARANYNLDDVRPTPMPLPPRNEQRRIVAKIEELFSDLDVGVAALERAKANLKRYRAAVLKAAIEGKLTAAWRAENPCTESAADLLQRILHDRRQKWEQQQLAAYEAKGKEPPKIWRDKHQPPAAPNTTNLPELPASWCWGSIEQLGDVQLGRQRSPKNRSKDYPTKYIRAANITERGLDLSDVLDMEFKPSDVETYQLHAGDLILSEASGSPDQVGKPAVWNDELPICCFQNTVIRFRPALLDSGYSLTVFKHYYVNKVFARIAGGVGINHLSARKFSKIMFPLAPESEQAQIVKEVDELLSSTDYATALIEVQLKRATRLRQSILKRAFEGKLVSQDPNDESARKLLDRISTSRTDSERNGGKTGLPRKPKRTRANR